MGTYDNESETLTKQRSLYFVFIPRFVLCVLDFAQICEDHIKRMPSNIACWGYSWHSEGSIVMVLPCGNKLLERNRCKSFSTFE